MLKIEKLTMENFGPYKGSQTIEFPDKGVVIIYGENGRGKTSLLNAIRYALYGKVLSRGSRKQLLRSVGNWEAAIEGNFGFRVILDFSSDGQKYVLTRSHRLRKDISSPQSDADFVEESFLKKDGVVLGPDEKDIELVHIMPEQVSRFFLFDGELLQEYEELLRDESIMGERITQAIERILGVPILTNARADMSDLHKQAQKQASRAAQKAQKTREFGNHLENAVQQRSYHEKEVARMESDLLKLRQDKQRLDSDLSNFERVKAWLDEIDSLKQDIDRIDDEIKQKEEKLQQYTKDIWRSMLGSQISMVKNKLEKEREILQQQVTEQALINRLDVALHGDSCPTCFQSISDDARTLIKAQLESMGSVPEFEESALEDVVYSLKILQTFDLRDGSAVISEVAASIRDLKSRRYLAEERIKERREQASEYDQSHVRALYVERDTVVKEIALVEKGLREEKDRITDLNESIRQLEKKLDEASGNDSSVERRRSDLYDQLYTLFEASVRTYRSELRKKVETDATRIFVQLTSEPDYVGLQITDTYGLVITHRDGQPIPVRSAGFEHVVALSLMGALQNNAPLRGPIIMDSPFGRLDEIHTTKVIQTLPDIADQVLLLVYRSELNPQVARDTLKGNLKGEYRMARQSARHTQLERDYGAS